MFKSSRTLLTIGVTASLLTLSACSLSLSSSSSAQSSANASTSQSNASYETQLRQALQSATSDFERQVLTKAIKAGKISEADYREANEKYQQCMVSKGDQISFSTDQSTGLMQESMNVDGQDYDSDKVNSDSIACARGTNLLIRDLYERMTTNPTNSDDIELIVDCLKRKKLVPSSFTKQDYLTESSKTNGSSKLDTSSESFSQCLANPNK
ncbi:hypothetical protein [Bifidobacterium dentium]|uniref:hypothetical protein n=1 Tax=Bifidobacterium dentium TaxID=1689 RepID=UPI001F5080F3|nr:hypothetical protein [Bifidobacterium dentium]